MNYQIRAPVTVPEAKCADELRRLLTHTPLTLQFVTVAGRYKPVRARMLLLTIADRFAEQAVRVMQVLTGREDATTPSAPVRQRPEWSQYVLLLPTDPQAAPPDGVLLDGWDSAWLTVTYRQGRALASLACCAEDTARLAHLSLPGWRLVRASPIRWRGAGGVWRGVPRMTPVPGGVLPALPPIAPIAPLADEVQAALAGATDGVVLGVTPDGVAVRLARRALTVAVVAPSAARERVLLALIRRGMQAGLGVVVAVDRALLPHAALAGWEARVRRLDGQDVAGSAALAWATIAPDLLAQAIAGADAGAGIVPHPARFGAVLDALGASALRVPAVLGLAIMPGDDLRGVLAAGGIVVVPQDGDAASALVARLLLAALATPPTLGRGLLLLLDPLLVPPDPLRAQAIQVVLGQRSDALLHLVATDGGWQVRGPDGGALAMLQADLAAQPAEGADDLTATIVAALGEEAHTPDDDRGMWHEPQAQDGAAGDEPDRSAWGWANAADQREAAAPADALVVSADALDTALDRLLATLLAAPPDADEGAIRALVAQEDFAEAEAQAEAWAARALMALRPLLWQVVLASDDAARAMALWCAIPLASMSAYEPLLAAVQAALDDDPGLPARADDAARAGLDGSHAATIAPVFADEERWYAPAPLDKEREGMDGTQRGEAASSTLVPGRDDRASALDEERERMDGTATPIVPAPYAPAPHLYGAQAVSDAMLYAAWGAGASVPQLVAHLIAMGVEATQARARLRAIIQPRRSMREDTSGAGINGAVLPIVPLATPPDVPAMRLSGEHPPAPEERINGAVLPMTPFSAPLDVPAMRLSGEHPPAPEERTNGAVLPIVPLAAPPDVPTMGQPTDYLPAPEERTNGVVLPITDDDHLWQRWLVGDAMETLLLALCGRRSGPKAEAARDHIYRVVIARLVADLCAADLLAHLRAGGDGTTDPRYPLLMQRLARSATPPMGALAQALRRRLLTTRAEVP